MAISTKPPAGTRDFLPDDVRRREYVTGIVRRVYERYGFEPLETPAYENIETLLGKYGEEGNKLIFKILKRGEHESSGEADLALRYDLTVPLARVVAQYQNQLPKFFKRYQIQPVWRAERPARGRFREFYQCDIDAIGSRSPGVEAEQIAAVSDVLTTLGFSDFTIRINHRQLLGALLSGAGLPGDQHTTAMVAIDKIDKVGVDGVREELTERGIAADAQSRILKWLQADYSADWSRRLAEECPLDEAGEAAVENLRQILSLVGTPIAERIRVAPSLARGLSYYTGAIMEITAPDAPGSLAGGGRYDNLIGMFLERSVPACGFSLGLERIIVLMTERQMFPRAVAEGSADLMVTIWSQGSYADALAFAGELRREGLRVETYPEADKLGKQFKYAADRHVPFVAVIGEEEQAANMVTIKEMGTGEQKLLKRSEAPAYIQGRRP